MPLLLTNAQNQRFYSSAGDKVAKYEGTKDSKVGLIFTCPPPSPLSIGIPTTGIAERKSLRR